MRRHTNDGKIAAYIELNYHNREKISEMLCKYFAEKKEMANLMLACFDENIMNILTLDRFSEKKKDDFLIKMYSKYNKYDKNLVVDAVNYWYYYTGISFNRIRRKILSNQ